MKEYIEMDSSPATTSSKLDKGLQPQPGSSSSMVAPLIKNKSKTDMVMNPHFTEKVIHRDYELRAITDRSISYLWVIIPVLCYFGVLVGGIMTCIGVGNAFAAFEYYCIFNANFTLIVTTATTGQLVLEEFRPMYWGSKNDCLFTEYASVALALFSGVWIVMVLQCGRGGASRRGFRLPDAWRIVPPTCFGNTVIFIISCFILNYVSTGWESFCANSILYIDGKYAKSGDGNISCEDILSFTYRPKDKVGTETGLKLAPSYYEHTDLLKQSRTSQIGATIQFICSLLSFLIVIIRCCTGPDFELYVRRQIEYAPANTEDEEIGQFNRILEEDDEDYDDDEFDDAIDDVVYAKNTAETTVICHHVPSTSSKSKDEGESDENSSFKSTTGLILN